MIKVFAFDIDGTLSYSNNEINCELKDLLNNLRNQGFLVVLATGRPYEDLKVFQKKNDFYTSAILMNGAAIIDSNQHYGRFKYISSDTAREICSILKRFDVPFVCYTKSQNVEYTCSNKSYSEIMLENLGYESDIDILLSTFVPVDENVFEHNEIFKIEACFTDLSKSKDIRKALSKVDNIHVVSSMSFNLEITSSITDKGKALMEYITSLGYQEDEVVVFGDSENDISMFEMFSNSVLVDNPEIDMKFDTKYITCSCKEDGVTKFIQSHFKI